MICWVNGCNEEGKRSKLVVHGLGCREVETPAGIEHKHGPAVEVILCKAHRQIADQEGHVPGLHVPDGG
jgi:hypothetical protein